MGQPLGRVEFFKNQKEKTWFKPSGRGTRSEGENKCAKEENSFGRSKGRGTCTEARLWDGDGVPKRGRDQGVLSEKKPEIELSDKLTLGAYFFHQSRPRIAGKLKSSSKKKAEEKQVDPQLKPTGRDKRLLTRGGPLHAR